MLFKILRAPLIITALAIVATGVYAGLQTAAIVAILTILEVSLSFDNAVVNAKVLGKMSEFWQKMFLTVGILIAVFGMRLIFPIIVVAIAAHLDPGSVIDMALHHPAQYAFHLQSAHSVIAAFGGMFLFMIFVDFMLEARPAIWLPFERHISRLPERANLPVAIGTILVLLALYGTPVAFAGLLGLGLYIGLQALTSHFDEDNPAGGIAKAGLATFLYLEVLDASFSFDGVTGAFAITNDVLVIALGLGLGALFVRSLTVYLVRAGKLAEYRYLEHGAHYAIGALALLLFVSIWHEIPELVTGLIGVAFIGAAFAHSLIANKEDRHGLEESPSSSLS